VLLELKEEAAREAPADEEDADVAFIKRFENPSAVGQGSKPGHKHHNHPEVRGPGASKGA